MNKFNRNIFLIAFFFISQFIQGQIIKYTDYETAKIEASKQNKDILIVLTGSDWCKPCIKMKKNVFSNPEFISFSEKNLIIFEINLSRHFDLDSKLFKDYDFFKKKYQTNALPCLILIDKNETTKAILSENLTSFDKTYKKLKELTNKVD